MANDMDIELFSFSDEEESSGDEQDSPPCATDCIEELVTSFLIQLSHPPGKKLRAGSDTDSEPEDANTTAKRTPVELRIADRKGGGALRTMRFPAKRATGSARPFAQLFRVLDFMHEAVVDGVPATKRDMYYRDVPLFKKQNVVDNLVDDLAATFELERADLNVRATSKGLVCGSGLVIHLNSGETVHANDTEGALIPVGEDIKAFTVAEDVEWVLVVEKDAVFQTLCRLRLATHPSLPRRGIIITGKGYPDVATRQLVATLSECLPRRIPLLGIVDGDPYGLDILGVYKYGSRAMAHEAEKLAAPRVKYLGVFASELASYGVDRDALLPITEHDEKKARAMLSRPIPAKWKKELSHMLHARRKAEIEVLSSVSSLSSTPPAWRDDDMRDVVGSPESFRSTSSSNSGLAGEDTPPTSQDAAAPTESLLMRYLVAKIGDYVDRAKARDEGSQ
ncbi:DNA topoisomerase IV alpha subunit [Mycena alexandri]|uniref:DNA topoisomerase (ATP-hydrolyzing) n=1 Tax=Mycena alexandri TaxID=1745969 RepID=A0AAD6TFS2_9AGAR|nr:DNA topoisomerase IV alpha subunit [Mycena alexandri]